MADASDTPAVDIGEAIQRGVALLAQQSVATPTFTMTAVADLYREGVRATKSRAPAARVLEAWADAAAALPAPLPMTIERALEGLSEPTVAEAVLAAYSTATGTRTEHYEFLSASAVASSAFELWTDLARPGQVLQLIASAGNNKTAAKAVGMARSMSIAIHSNLYRVGDVVAELRIPAGGICLRKTSNVNSNLARHLRNDLPFALCFELVKWYSPIEAPPATDRRVSYACSSFGVSIPGAVACKCQ